MLWIVPPGVPHPFGSGAGRCERGGIQSGGHVSDRHRHPWRPAGACPVPTKPARCLIQPRPDGAGEHPGSRSFHRRSSIIGIGLPPPVASALLDGLLATCGRDCDQVISRSASADLIRHPVYQEWIVPMADCHCEAGTAHILVDQPMIAWGATPS